MLGIKPYEHTRKLNADEDRTGTEEQLESQEDKPLGGIVAEERSSAIAAERHVVHGARELLR